MALLTEQDRIVTTGLDGQPTSTLTGRDPDLGENLHVGYLQVAYQLLGEVRSRPAGDPDRGPWPPWLRVLLGGCLTVVVVTVGVPLWLVRRRHRRAAAG